MTTVVLTVDEHVQFPPGTGATLAESRTIVATRVELKITANQPQQIRTVTITPQGITVTTPGGSGTQYRDVVLARLPL